MLLGLLEDYAPLSIISLLPSNRLLPFSNRGAAISHLKEKRGPTPLLASAALWSS